MLYGHSHGGRREIGANELMDGRSFLLSPFGPLLARAGYVTLCMDMPTFGDRHHTEETAAAKAHIWYGTSLIGQMISEQAAALTYLSSRDDVDAERIGAFGISLGSTLAYWHAALDLRLRAIAHLCCYADYATLVELGAHDNHGIYLLVPGMLNHISTGEIAGLVAPRPQLICLGEDDELTPPLSIERALAVTRPMYDRAGAPEALEVFLQAGVDHRETPEMHEKVMAFFAARAPARDVKYAIVGAGSRHAMYRDALVEHAIDPSIELVALCDPNAKRLALSASRHPRRVPNRRRPL